MLVATFRDVDPAIGGPLAQTLGVLARNRALWRLPLAGLSEGECHAFIAQTFGVEPSPAVAAAVHARTDGNPFFVGELARLLAGEGTLQGDAPHDRVPEGVRDVIRRRLLRLPAKTNALLAMANEKLWLGHFDLWSEENLPVFRHALMLRDGVGVSTELLEDLVDIAVTECERFYPAFQFVIWGGKPAAEALAAAMLETEGEA